MRGLESGHLPFARFSPDFVRKLLRALLAEIVDTTPSARFASLEPPIIYIDDFLSAAECSSIIAAGTPGLRASAGAGKVQSDGKFQKLNGDFRSSSNSWCTGSCASDATVRSVEARIANLTGFDSLTKLQV